MTETRIGEIELLERVRSAAQAYVNAPMKFGIRHKAYRSLVKALDEHALAGESPVCEWKQDDLDDLWETSCGQAWTFIDGGPEDNHVRFCHSCGRKVLAIAAGEEKP
jgi:hypothetical protein